MMRRLRLLLLLLPVVGVLAACSIAVFPVTPTPVNAYGPSSSSTPVDSLTLAVGQPVYYEVDVTSAALSYPVLQVEVDADQPVNLTLYGSASNVLASASSGSFFASGSLGLASLATTAVAPQSITLARTCLGPCIIQKLYSSVYYVRVENRGTASANVNLYAFARNYDDPYEVSGNDTWNGAVTLPVSSSGDNGAIETLGDVDYWRMANSGTLTFSSSSAVPLEAVVYDSSHFYVTTLYPGDSYYPMLTDDHVEVHAVSDNEAAVAGASQYFLTLQ